MFHKYEILLLCLLWSTPGSAESCISKLTYDSYGHSSCWDEERIDKDGHSFVFLSLPAIETMFGSNFRPLIHPRSVEYQSLSRIRGYVSEERGRYAALFLQNTAATNFVKNECNIYSVEDDLPSRVIDIFISPNFLTNGKTCEDVKLFLAYVSIRFAEVAALRESVNSGGFSWDETADLRWVALADSTNTTALSWAAVETSASIAGFIAKPVRVKDFEAANGGENLQVALKSSDIVFFFEPSEKGPIAVMSQLGDFANDPALASYDYSDYVVFVKENGEYSEFRPEIFSSYFIDGSSKSDSYARIIENKDKAIVVSKSFSKLRRFEARYKISLEELDIQQN